MASQLPEIDLTLPYITEKHPGIGGKIRQKSSHFIVEEIPLYEASGEGIHLYLNITKQDINTRDIQIELAKLFNLDQSMVGKAGLKDKYAIATQTFSVVFDGFQPDPEKITNQIEEELPIKVNWAKYHTNKLRVGHLLGNRFTITVTDVESNALEKAEKITESIHKTGIPNFYGIQRTGEEGGNILQGWQLLKNKKRISDKWLRKFLISSYQSYLCNQYLKKRIDQDKFTNLVQGDIAKKHDTGGEFIVKDLKAEQSRFKSKEISFTAPMFGYKMREAQDESGKLETKILDSVSITKKDFRKNHIKGTRRIGRILPEIAVSENKEGIEVSFFLRKGSYATVVLREFMKNDALVD